MDLFDYIIIREHFLPDHINELLVKFANSAKILATVGAPTTQITNPDYRQTNVHNLSGEVIGNLKNSVSIIHETIINPRYKSILKNIEIPQLLSYDINGHYDEHNDCEDYVNNILTKVVDRDITMIIYLNDNYTGGELEFTKLGLTYRPKKNSMIIFPSYYEFSHRVHPVKSGTRINLVCWLATKDRIYVRE